MFKRPPPLIGIIALSLFAIVMTGGRALAQNAPQRGGFTILLDLGAGVQRDGSSQESTVGLAGLNLGVGGFLTKDLALMFRLSGTSAQHDHVSPSGLPTLRLSRVSGVGGTTLQYWVSDRFNVEGGGGWGHWTIKGGNALAFGLIVGSGVTIFNRGKHNLQFGVHYAPAFTNPRTVHNIGFTVGYQFL